MKLFSESQTNVCLEGEVNVYLTENPEAMLVKGETKQWLNLCCLSSTKKTRNRCFSFMSPAATRLLLWRSVSRHTDEMIGSRLVAEAQATWAGVCTYADGLYFVSAIFLSCASGLRFVTAHSQHTGSDVWVFICGYFSSSFLG